MPNLKISVILPVLNETFALRETVDTLLRVGSEHIHEILIMVARRTTPESHAVIRELQEVHPGLVRVQQQTLPFLGGAMQEAFALATGEHVLLMSSDLETNPSLLPAFVAAMQSGPWDIVAASRWIEGGGFEGYGRVKLALNYFSQRMFRLVYGTRLTDLTYAYRLYRREILQGYRWEELRHPFLLECLLKPLRCGARATEIPCQWQARPEGGSANTLARTFVYLRIAIKARFTPRARLRKVHA